MYCKICGTFNEDNMEYCVNCAAPLEPDAGAPGAPQGAAPVNAAATAPNPPRSGFSAAPSWPKPDFDANTVLEDDIPDTYKRRYQQTGAEAPAYQEPAAGYGYGGETAYQPEAPVYGEDPYAPQGGYDGQDYQEAPYQDVPQTETGYDDIPDMPRSYGVNSAGAGYQSGRNFGGYDSVPTYDAAPMEYADPMEEGYYGFDEGEDDLEDEDYAPRKRSGANRGGKKRSAKGGKKRGASDGRMKTILFWAAAAVLVILIAVFLIIFFTQRSSSTGGGFLSGLFSSSPITDPPTVEQGETAEGDPAYIITVYAKNGYTVRFTAGDLVRENEITDRSLKLRIPEAVWIPDEPVDSATIEVTPNIVLISSDGEETPVEFETPIVITLPTIDLALTEPVGTSVTSTTGQIAISGVVGDTTASVFVGDQQLSVDEAGNFSGSYAVTESGTVSVEARKNGYKIQRITLDVTYSPETSAPVTSPDPSTTTTPGTTSAGIVGYANTNSLNIRSEASTDGSILGTYAQNEVISILEEDVGNGWVKVLYNNAEAYVAKQYVNVLGASSSLSSTTATVNTSDLNFRSAASTSSTILAKLARDTAVTVLSGSASTEWCTVQYDGKIGYLASRYLSFQ